MTLKTLAQQVDEKGLELLCEIAPEIPEVVTGDPSRLRQVVTNLVGNAIKDSTHQGEVVADGAPLDAENGEERTARFRVSDTGIGIPAEKQYLIFDPFSRGRLLPPLANMVVPAWA